MLGVQSTTAGSSAPYLSPPRTGTLFPSKPPSTTTTMTTAPPPASAPAQSFAAPPQQHQQQPPPSSAPSLQPHYEYSLQSSDGEMNGALGERGQSDQPELSVSEGHSSPERVEQQSVGDEGLDTVQDVSKESVNGADRENGVDEVLRTSDAPTDGNNASSHPPELTGELSADSDASRRRESGQTVGNDQIGADVHPAATAVSEDSNIANNINDAAPGPAQTSLTDSSTSDNAAPAPEQNSAAVPAPEIERRMSSPLSELSPAPGEEDGEEGADNDEDADESNDQKGGSNKAERSDPALLFADMMGPTPPSTSSNNIYHINHTNVNSHGKMGPGGHPHQRPINAYPYPPSSSASKLSQTHLYGLDPSASMGMNIGMNTGLAHLHGQLPMKGDANKKALAILELNAELLKICVAFQNNGIALTVPEAQLYARKLNSNLTWLASRVDNSKSNIDIPELEPPSIPLPGSTTTSISKDVLDRILPKETSDRIAALYAPLPALFARDLAKRERRTQSQHQHHAQGVGTRGTPGPPTQIQMQPPMSAGGMHGVQAPHLQQSHSMQQGVGHVHGMPPPLATPTSSTGPMPGSGGVKRERVESADVHDAKRRDTGEGKRLSATPGPPPLTPSASASASAVHTPQQQQLPLHSSHSMPPPPPPGSAGHGSVSQGPDLMTRPGSARPASRAGDRGSPYSVPPTSGSADFGAGAPPGSGISVAMQPAGQGADAHMRAQQMMHQQRIMQQQRMAQQQRQQGGQGPLTPSQSGFPQQVQLGQQQQPGQAGQQQQQHSQVQIPQAQQSPPPGMPDRRTPQQQAGVTANPLSMTPPHIQQANQQSNQGRPGEGTPVPGGPPALVQARQMSPPSSMGALNPQAMGTQLGMGGMNSGGVMQGQPGGMMGAGAGMGAAMGNMSNMNNMPGANQQVLQQIMQAGPAAMTVYQQLQNPSNPMTIYLNQSYPGFSSLPVPEQMRRWQVVNQNMQQRRSQGMMSGQMAAGLGQMRPPTTAPGASGSGSMQPPSQSTPGRPGQGSQGQQMGMGMGMTPGRMGQPQVPGMNQGMSNAAALAGMQGGMANMPNAAMQNMNMANMANMSDSQRQQLMLMQMQARNVGNPASGSGMMNQQMLVEQQRLAMQRAGAPGSAAGMNSPGGSGPTGGGALPGIARSSRPSSSAGAGGMGNMSELAGGATPRLGGRGLPGQQPGMGAPGMGGMPGQGAVTGMGIGMGGTDEYHRALIRNAQQQQYQLMQSGAGVGGMGAPGGLGPSAWPQQTQMSIAPGAWPQQGAVGSAQGFGGGDLSGMGGMGMMGMGAQRQMSATPAPGLAQQHSPAASSNEFEGMQMW